MQRTASGIQGRSDSTKDAEQMGAYSFSVWYETWYKLRISKLNTKRAELRPSTWLTMSSRTGQASSRRNRAPGGGFAPGEGRGLQGQDKPGSEGLQESWDKPRPPKGEQAEALYPEPVEQGRQAASAVFGGGLKAGRVGRVDSGEEDQLPLRPDRPDRGCWPAGSGGGGRL